VTDQTQFDQGGFSHNETVCEQCRALAMDAADGVLSAAEHTFFERHILHCATCGAEWAAAQRGAAWLDVLKTQRPEPSADLLGRILAQTTGAAAIPALSVTASTAALQTARQKAQPAGNGIIVTLPNGKQGIAAGWMAAGMMTAGTMTASTRAAGAKASARPPVYAYLHTRLAMTAAMAFFSLALTLNVLSGGGLKPSSFTPSGIRRSLADTRASVARGFAGNRLVYQAEASLSSPEKAGAGQ
jgi:hypothetical protein